MSQQQQHLSGISTPSLTITPTGVSGGYITKSAGLSGALILEHPNGASGVSIVIGTSMLQDSGVEYVATKNWVLGLTGSQGFMGDTGYQGLTGYAGLTGVMGLTGANGAQGTTGTVGLTGASGVQGTTGAIGLTGTMGLTGKQGLTGTVGITGANGVQGLTGTVGLTGANGAQGLTGAVGLTGTMGLTGKQGLTGTVGLTGSNGVQGLTGVDGVQGPTGANGVQGITGTVGVTGANGVQGLTGVAGLTGTAGITGEPGVQGNTGFMGTTGADGVQGLTGSVGITGTIGITGAPGVQGITGIQGQAGVQGITGTVGLTGAVGIPGAQGVTGEQGAPGVEGIMGATGAKGDTGAMGLAGANGAQGSTGAEGPQGFQGITGFAGITGYQGITGSKGPDGDTGLQGAQGSTGATGETGAQGLTGPGFQYKGSWYSGAEYFIGDVVRYAADNGSVWACVQAHSQPGHQPNVSSEYWSVFASDGTKGDQGDPGNAGSDGSTGPQGDTGMQGPAGETGAQGAPGTALGGCTGLKDSYAVWDTGGTGIRTGNLRESAGGVSLCTEHNASLGVRSVALGGSGSVASGDGSATLGGYGNGASGTSSMAIGGLGNTLTGQGSIAIGGISLTAVHDGAVMIGGGGEASPRSSRGSHFVDVEVLDVRRAVLDSFGGTGGNGYVLGSTGGSLSWVRAPASSVTFTPTGNIAATDVQAAIAELDGKVVHIAGKETVTGAKTFYSTAGYTGVANLARLDSTTTGTIWCANIEKVTPAASTPADGMGPGLAFVHSKDNAPDTKYGLGAIEFQRNGSDTSGKFVVNTRNAGVDTYPLMADQSGVEAYCNLTIRSTSAQTAGSELRFMPTYNDSDSGKQFVSWWNTAGDTHRALIGYREGGLPDTNDKDLRIVSVYPSGTAYASGQRGVRIGTALDTTSEAGTGSFTVAPYGNSHVGIWPGFVAAAGRTTSNYALLAGNTSTWVNAPSESGTVGIAINDVSMMEIKNNLITCFTGAAGAMTVNGNNFSVNAATADLSGTTTTYLPGVTFSAFPLYTKQPVLTTTTSGLTSGLIAWCDQPSHC